MRGWGRSPLRLGVSFCLLCSLYYCFHVWCFIPYDFGKFWTLVCQFLAPYGPKNYYFGPKHPKIGIEWTPISDIIRVVWLFYMNWVWAITWWNEYQNLLHPLATVGAHDLLNSKLSKKKKQYSYLKHLLIVIVMHGTWEPCVIHWWLQPVMK